MYLKVSKSRKQFRVPSILPKNNSTWGKVQLFWEGHKTMRKIAQIFVAFSEKLNFIEKFVYTEKAPKFEKIFHLKFDVTE